MKRNVILIVLIAVGFFVYTEYFQVTDETTRDASGEVVEAGEVSAGLNKVGDCIFSALMEVGDYESKFKTVPCTELHDSEIVGRKDLLIDTWPGEATSNAWDEHSDFCLDDYESYTGLDFETGPHQMFPFMPSKEMWDSGDKLILCVAQLPNGELMGASIKG